MSNDINDAPVVYQIRPKNRGAHLFEVSCLIDAPDPNGQQFSLPAWIPGSYMVRDYSRHVISVEAEVAGDPVALTKIDKSTWRAEETGGALLLRAEIYANDLSVRGAFLDTGHAFINGVCVFFRVHGVEEQHCVVHVLPPRNQPDSPWRVATCMRRLTGTDLDFGAFVADSYDELIDHPFLLGDLSLCEFNVAGALHTVAIAGQHEGDLRRLAEDLSQVCEYQQELFGGSPPFDCYSFLLTVLNSGYGGLEHRNSSALICGRDNLPRSGETKINDSYRKLLGLFSHEYFHLWNVKRIKPTEFVPYDLEKENYTRQLWVFEGITSYYDDLSLLRSGLVSADSYLELLGRTLTAVYRSAGRRRQTLEESSFDAWTKFYKQNENSPNAIVSYYSKGAMVAAALDLELRLQTEGRCSLDTVMREVWDRYGRGDIRGIPEGGFEILAEEVSGLNLKEFFHQSLRTTVDPPIGILLAQFGIRLNMRAADEEGDTGGKPAKRKRGLRPWLGFRTQARGGRVFVRNVAHDDSTAGANYVSANDEIVALNGRRATAANYESLLDQVRIDETIDVDVFRRDDLMRIGIVAATPPRDRCFLTFDPEPDEQASQRRIAWLGV